MTLETLKIKKIWGYSKGNFQITYVFYERRTEVTIIHNGTTRTFMFDVRYSTNLKKSSCKPRLVKQIGLFLFFQVVMDRLVL